MKRTPPKEAAAPAGRELALLCAEAAGDGKAIDTVIPDMRSVSSIADYFVICGGSSNRQAKAIAERVERAGRERGARCYRSEGWSEARWIVLDYVDVVVHVFLQETRRYYALERLWGDAGKVEIKDQ